MFSLIRRWASHLIHKHGQKFVKAVPQELLQFSFSSCSVELPLLEIQEKVLENLGVLLPLEVQSARLEDVAVSWRGSSCTIVVKARKLVVEAQMRPYQEWAEVLRTAPELASHDAARSFKAALLKAHEQEVLSLARRLLGREAMGASLVPDLELELGNDQGGFELLMEHQATARICVTGQTLALQGGLCLRDVLSPSKAWRLDLRLRGLSAHCQVDGPTSTPCIGPCQLQLDFTFGKRGSAVPDWMFVEAGNEEELPKVSLTVTSRSCPIRASIRQISALSKHGVSWGRWFALKEAVTVEFEEAMMESSPLSEVAQRGEAAEYRRLWMSRLPRRLESAQVRKETKDTDKDANGAEAEEDDDDESAASDTDPQIVAFEEAHLLRETLRQRRLALLEESVVDDENRTYVYSAQRCLCTSAVSGNMILQDPTARHTFVLTVNLTSSEVELLDEQSKLTVAPTSEESSIYVQLGVHDHPALKPLDLSLTLDQCQLLRSGADLPLLTLRRFWLAMDLAESDPELAVRSREMPGLAPEAKLDPLRMHLGVESLQGCFSYLALMAVTETIQQLQEDLLEAVAEDLHTPSSFGPSTDASASLEMQEVTAFHEILAMIRDARPGQPPEPSNVKDYRIHTSGAPITLLMPVQSASADVDESVLGPSFLGLLVVQLLAECGPAQIEPELGDVVCHRMPPSAAAASVWEVQGLAAWLLPEPLGRELLAVGAAEAPVRPAHLLLSCGRLWCEATSDFRRAEVRVDPLLLQLEASEVLLLAQLLRSFESGDSDDKAEAPEAEPGVAPVLDVAVAGMSLQVLRPSRKAAKGVLHEVVAVLDLGSTHLQLGEEKLKLRLQHVLLSDAVQNFFLLRWQDAQGSAPCVELRKDAHGARLVLRHLQVCAHWHLLGSLCLALRGVQSALATAEGSPRARRAPGPKAPLFEPPQLPVQVVLQQVGIFLPSGSGGPEEGGGLVLGCGLQMYGGPQGTSRGSSRWKARVLVSQLSLMEVDNLMPRARSGTSPILHPMRVRLSFTHQVEATQRRPADSVGLHVQVDPVRVSVLPSHLKIVAVLQANIDILGARLQAEPAPAKPQARARRPPWTGHLKVDLPALRVGAGMSVEEPESCILMLEAVRCTARAAFGTAMFETGESAAEQAAAAAAAAAASVASAKSAKAAAQVAAASAAAAAAAAANALDAEEVTADFCLEVQAEVGAVCLDIISNQGSEEEHVMPLLEPTRIHVGVPAYQGLQTAKKVWNGRELMQVCCPSISISWINLHASDVAAAVLARLHSCFEEAQRGRTSVSQKLLCDDQAELAHEKTGRLRGQNLRNSLGTEAVLLVAGWPNRMIARLPEGHALALEEVKRKAQKLSARSKVKRHKLRASRTALMAEMPRERYNPVRSMLPVWGKAEDFMMGAGSLAVSTARGAAQGAVVAAKGAVKDTVKSYNDVMKELKRAAAAGSTYSEQENGDEDDLIESEGLTSGRRMQNLQNDPSDLGLALLPGWPTADLRCLSQRAVCAVIELPLLPASVAKADNPRLDMDEREEEREDREEAHEEVTRSVTSSFFDTGSPSSSAAGSTAGSKPASPVLTYATPAPARQGTEFLLGELPETAKKSLLRMNTSASQFVEETQRTVGKSWQVAQSYATEFAEKAVSKVKNLARHRQRRKELVCQVLVRKAAPRKDAEAMELELSSTIFLENRSNVPLLVLPLAEEEEGAIPTIHKNLGWLVLHPGEPPQPLPLFWCVSQRVLKSLVAAQAATVDLASADLAKALDDSADSLELSHRVETRALQAANNAFESRNTRSFRPWCCPLAALHEAGVNVVDKENSGEVWMALKNLRNQGRLQPLLDDAAWNVMVGMRKTGKQDVRGRCFEDRLRGLCTAIHGIGLSRPRSATDSLFFVVTVQPTLRLCNRLCCSLRIFQESEDPHLLLPGEDLACQGSRLPMELLLPASVDTETEEEREEESFTLHPPLQLAETANTPSSRRSTARSNTCFFKGRQGQLIEVKLQREEGVGSNCPELNDLHGVTFGSRTCQLTLFVSHWLVNRVGSDVVIPRVRGTQTKSGRFDLENPLMKVPAHSMRPLSSHALSVDGVIELGLAQEGSPQASEAPTMRKRKSVLFREPKHLPRTASMSADRPGNGGVLPALMSGPDSGLCLGFSVRQAPFPFYRTMVVEVMRRYTLVNLKDSTLWVCDGSGPTMKLEPGRAVAYHPDKHTEFHLDISGVGPHTFTAGFRLSQLFSLAGDGASGASGAGRRGKLQLMYLTRTGGSPGTRQVSCESLEEADSESREVWRTRIKDLKRSETESLDNERWALACVEALEHSAALVLRFSDPVKPQFRMVNRSRHSVVFRQDHVGAPTFKLGPEDVVPFAWFSPPGNGPAAIPKAEEVGTPSLLLGAADLHEDRDDVARTPKHRYHIAQVREHKHLEFSDRAVRRRMTLRTAKPEEPPDLYKVRTVVHQGSLEVHIHPWVRVRNETKWQVLVRDSADQERCKIVDPDDSVDLWPHSHKNEMLFQMKRVGGSQHDVLGTEGTFDWSQPLTLSESMTGYRGFFRQRCGGEANTVEVSVSRDETSGFLRLTLSTCKQEPFLIENRSSHKCKFAPKNATGWVMHLTKGDGECPFFSHLWGGDTCMTVSIGRGEAQDSYDFDLAVPGTHNFKDLTIEVGKVKERPKLVLVKDAVPRRRSIRDKGRKTLVRLNMAFKDPETTAKGKKGVSVSFAPDSFAPSLAGSTTTPVPSLRQWVQFSSTMNTTRRRRPASGRRCCLPLPAARDSARNSRKAALPEQRKNLAGLEWTLDLSLEGIGLAMLDVQLDSGESAEIGYAALKALKVRLSQHTSQTNVEGRAGALAAELSLGSVQLDVGSGDQKHQSKACHSVLRPFTGPLQILSENQEPLPMVHLEALLKLVTENQEDGQAIERGDRSAHYEVRRLELKVQPLGLHIETALVSEVVVWVMDLCSVLQTGKKENYSPEHLAAALDAEAAGDGALVDLKYCEPRCVRDPTADDFKDQTPVVIRELILRRICCVMTLSFTGTGSFRRERNEEVQAFEMLLRLTLPLDVHQARLMLGKIVFGWRGWSVQDFSVRERFLSNGAEELGDTLTREVTRAVLQQVPKLFGSQLLIGNPLRLGEELLRALELAAFGCTTFKPQVVLAAFFLSFAAITTSLRGMFLIISKEACRLSTGQVPDQLLRESARVREAVAQALYYGIPWHCSAVFQRLRGRWRKSQGQRRCEACRATLPALLFSLLAPISVLLVTVTKLLQAMELSSRRTARWVSPKHVTAIGPPLPTRTGSQQFTAGYPKQFSRAAAPALVALTSNAALAASSEWALRELPSRNRANSLETQESDDGPWGWLLLLRLTSQLILLRPQRVIGLRVELVEPPPAEAWRAQGPFRRVELCGDGTVLRCYRSKSKVEQLSLPCTEAGLAAFSLAAQNQI